MKNFSDNRNILYAAVVLLFICRGVIISAEEKLILDEQWKEYADGGEPQAPWIISGTSEALPDGQNDKDSVKIEDGWAVVDNSGNEPGNWNPGLSAAIDLKGEKLASVSFTYRVDRDYTDASQILFCLNQGKKNLASIVLGKNYQYKGIINRLSGKKYEEVGHRFSPGEEVTLTMDNFDFAKKTFSLSWKSSTGKSGAKAGLSFANKDVTSVDKLWVSDSSTARSQSKIFIKDIRVAAE